MGQLFLSSLSPFLPSFVSSTCKELRLQNVRRNLKVTQGNPCLIMKQLYYSFEKSPMASAQTQATTVNHYGYREPILCVNLWLRIRMFFFITQHKPGPCNFYLLFLLLRIKKKIIVTSSTSWSLRYLKSSCPSSISFLRLNFFVCVCFPPHYSLYIWTSLSDMWKLGALMLVVVPS